MSSSSAAPSTALSDRQFRLIALLLALLALAVRCWMAITTHSTAEDFLISLRYAENVAHGQGFVFNPGLRVLGTTTPLYTLLLAFSVWLHLDGILAGKALNILADTATVYLLARLLARPEIGQPVAGVFAAILYSFSTTPLSISIAGMETGLVTCVCIAAIYAYVAAWETPLYVLGALLFLFRIDGLALFALLAGGLALRQHRIPWRAIGLFLAISLPWVVFAFAYFGSPVPTSLIAKVIVYKRGIVPRYLKLDIFATQFTAGAFQKLVTFLFVVGMVAVLADLGYRYLSARQAKTAPESGHNTVITSPQWGILSVPALWLLLYYGAMLFSDVPAFAWYFLPPWPLFLGLSALGGSCILSSVARLFPTATRTTAGKTWPVGLGMFGLFALMHTPAVRSSIVDTQRLEDVLRRPLGYWFRAHAKPDERILLEPIGYVGYYSRRPILDMIGLVSPEVIPSYHRPNYLTDIVQRLRPEWLCLRPQELSLVDRGDPQQIKTHYRFIREFRIDGGPVQFLVYHRKQDSATRLSH